MKTQQLYMHDPYLKTLNANILEFSSENTDTFILVLDRTLFYPMGGGQPTDQGKIIFSDGQHAEVFQVIIKDGEIKHYVKSTRKPFLNEEVILELNWTRRFKNMQVHTAGHIIDFAVHILGYSPDKLAPFKGDHGKKPYVQYLGTTSEDIVIFKTELQKQVNDLIAKDLKFSWEFSDLNSLKEKAIYLQPNLPTNKPLRCLTLEGIGSVADGGTICRSTSEVEAINILNIEVKDNLTTIYYDVVEADKKKDTQFEVIATVNDDIIVVEEKNTDLTTVNDISSTTSKNYSLTTLEETVRQEIENADSEEALTLLWRKYLGKDGAIKNAMSKITEITIKERKQYGSQVNELKNQIDSLINNKKEQVKLTKTQEYLNQSSEKISYKKPKIGHYHPLTETINQINQILARLGYSVYDGPELETDEFLFQRCNVPMDHPARDLQDSIYVEEPNILLRTQTSSVEAHALIDLKPPFKIVVPGKTYRNEKVNRSNHFTFHQYQLVCVQEKVSMAELISTIDYLFKSYLGEDVEVRYRNKYYPEVEPGVGLDQKCPFCKGEGCSYCKFRGWVEMGGAGIIHPNIMRMSGLNTDEWQGFAFGLGLDRWAMAKHGITDIRTLLGGNLAYKPKVR